MGWLWWPWVVDDGHGVVDDRHRVVNAGGYGEGDGGYGEGDDGYYGDGIVKAMVKVSAVVVEVMTNQTAFLEQRSI